MKPGIESLWIILTVMVPGLIFYGTFRVLIAVLGITIPFISVIEEQEIPLTCVLFAVMFSLQLIGIGTESIAFKIGPYRDKKNPAYQESFERRYEIIATLDPEKDFHVERIVGQFFMSHNISIGMMINLLWTVTYLFIFKKRFDSTAVMTATVLFVITLFSIYVPCNRFKQSCKALYAHLHKSKTKEVTT